MHKPKVSIVIPVFNGSNYLAQSIHSALSQTYANKEILVINDGSNDHGKSEAIAKSFSPSIRYFSKSNRGVASALNLGIQNMTGDYFSWLSHDDLYFPEKIEKQVEHLTQFPLGTISFCDFETIDEKGTPGTTVSAGDYDSSLFKSHLLQNNFLHGCSLLIPKMCFDKVGVFNEKLITTNDYDLWFRMAEYFQYEYFPQVLIQSRQHSEQTNQTMSQQHRKECNTLYIHLMNHLHTELSHPSLAQRALAQRALAQRALPDMYFAILAVKFYKNDFLEASAHAYYLYKKCLQQEKKMFLPPFYMTRLLLKLYTIKKSLNHRIAALFAH